MTGDPGGAPTRNAARADALGFLRGTGDMARRIREKAWDGHPFGPPESWPQSLRSALSICLNSAFPTAIYWGPELRLLYNDAWAPIPGPRHPGALGAPAREVWADIWPVIGPQFARVMERGESVLSKDQLLPMRRYGRPEETYWSYNFSPIRGEAGEVAGVFNSGVEVTDAILSQRRMRLMLALGEALRAAGDPGEAMRAALRLLGESHGADGAAFFRLAPDGAELRAAERWSRSEAEPLPDRLTPRELGAEVFATLAEGEALRIEDASADPRLAGPEPRGACARMGLGAALIIPLLHGGAAAGRGVSALILHGAEPRAWTDFEVAILQQAAERTRSWVAREQAAARERLMASQIDHRAKNALAVAQAILRLTRAEDIESFRAKAEARIAALARAHDLLARQSWGEVELHDVLTETLAPFARPETLEAALDGPALRLPPELAQSLSLILHELGSDAVKEGALRDGGDGLRIVWRLEPGRLLALSWIERLTPGGPDDPSAPAPAGGGFGSVLIRRVLNEQLRGRLRREMDAQRRLTELRIPLDAAAAAPFDPAAPAGIAEAAVEARARAEPPARPRVLIAEDETLVAMDMEMLVEELGYEVQLCAETLETAEAALHGPLPDAAVLDLNLHGASTLGLAAALAEYGVPVIFVTGYQELPKMPAALRGARRLSKPLGPAMLARALAEATGRDAEHAAAAVARAADPAPSADPPGCGAPPPSAG